MGLIHTIEWARRKNFLEGFLWMGGGCKRKDFPSEDDLCFEHTSGSGVVEGGGWYASMIF